MHNELAAQGYMEMILKFIIRYITI